MKSPADRIVSSRLFRLFGQRLKKYPEIENKNNRYYDPIEHDFARYNRHNPLIVGLMVDLHDITAGKHVYVSSMLCQDYSEPSSSM